MTGKIAVRHETSYCCLYAFICSCILFVLFNTQHQHPLSKNEQLVNSTLAQTAKLIKDKYDLRPCGAGAAMPGGPIQKLTLCFNTKHSYTKEELRALLIQTAHELVSQVSNNKEIQEFLKDPPFRIKHVQIIIYNKEKDGREVYDPRISTAEISRSMLSFQTVDPANVLKYKYEFEETYEEALEKM